MTDWSEVASAIEAQLPSESGFRVPLGEDLAERLRTYGTFRDELEREREFDEAVAATHDAEPIAPTPAVAASVTIGTLRLTSRLPGEQGNDIRVTVADGAAVSFAVQPVDPALAEQHRVAAVSALDGTIANLSTDPAIAQIQQDAAAFLASIDATTRESAAAQINERWPDYREAREGVAIPRERKKLADSLDSLGLSSDLKTYALNTWDARDAAVVSASANVFTLTVTKGETVETYAEIVSGFDFPIASSLLLQSATWLDPSTGEAPVADPSTEAARADAVAAISVPLSDPPTAAELEALASAADALQAIDDAARVTAERPANGTYQISGGVGAQPGRAGRKAARPAGDYVFRVDSDRSFTLPELRDIVSQAIEGGREWLATA